MAQIIDLTGKITNELPIVRISNELSVTVNNRKSVILSLQAMLMEIERKDNEARKASVETGAEYTAPDDTAIMAKALKMLVGEKSAEAIEEMDLPLPEYKLVYEAIMNLASGADSKTP